MKRSNPSRPLRRDELCENCHKRPKYTENGLQHSYCSRSCARTPRSCKFLGCQESGKTAFSGYCSERHSRNAVQIEQVAACSRCGTQPRAFGDLCLSCNHAIQTFERIRLQELEGNRTGFKTLAAKITRNWKEKGSMSVERVYEVLLPRTLSEARSDYRKKVDDSCKASTMQAFYSAQCICDLGNQGPQLCNMQSCGICTALRSSFEEFEFGAKTKSGRFGNGMYFSTSPGGADRFATSSTTSPYRVMVECEVSVPERCSHSIMGVESAMDEKGVYVSNAMAVIPKHVIMYTR